MHDHAQTRGIYHSHAHPVGIHMQICMNTRIAQLSVTVQDLRFAELYIFWKSLSDGQN